VSPFPSYPEKPPRLFSVFAEHIHSHKSAAAAHIRNHKNSFALPFFITSFIVKRLRNGLIKLTKKIMGHD